MTIIAETDLQVLNAMRNKVSYGGTKNSLVEWTLSDRWAEPSPPEEEEKFRRTFACSGEISNAR